MLKKLIITAVAGSLIILTYSTISLLEIRAYRGTTVISQKYDADGALKLPDTETDMQKRKTALKALAEAIKKQEEPVKIQEVKLSGTDEGQKALKDGKLDYEKLAAVDNTMYSWWIKLNDKNEPTTIPAYARRIIENNGGIYLGDTSQKKIYLTFDEGYENGYTSRILDTLKENNVRSIFFVTGPYVQGNKKLIRRMLDEGHLVGNHTIHHPSLPSLEAAKLENELFGLEKEFKEAFGIGFKYMRPPRGEYSERVLAASRELGYKTVFWSFAYKDFDVNDQKGADYAYKKVMDNLHNGGVILLHAVSKDNAGALDRIIKDVRAKGYEICPFDL